MRKLENIFILPHLTVRSGPLSILRLNTRTDNLILEIKRQTNIARTVCIKLLSLKFNLDSSNIIVLLGPDGIGTLITPER